MKVIVPRPVKVLTDTFPPTGPNEWSETITYDIGDTVKITSIFPNRIYESLRDNNLEMFPPDSLEPNVASSYVFVSLDEGVGDKEIKIDAGLGFAEGLSVKLEWPATPNAVKMTADIKSFEGYVGSKELWSVRVHSSTNTGFSGSGWRATLVDPGPFWRDLGATNEHALFDEFLNTRTENSWSSFYFDFDVGDSDHLAAFGLHGGKVEISGRLGSSTKWRQEFDITRPESFTPPGTAFIGGTIPRRDILVFCEFQPGFDRIRFYVREDPGANDGTACSNVVIGKAFEIGTTMSNPRTGIIDFSTTEDDDQGRKKVTQGYWAKRNTITVSIENHRLDAVYAALASLRGVPTAWSANNPEINYEAFVVYGVLKDFDIILSDTHRSICEIEIEGYV